MQDDLVIGIDIGGTFTDFVCIGRGSGRLRLHKRLTTTDAPEQAVIEGVNLLLGDGDGRLGLAVHGTTLITNALIERKGARTALLATSGHADVIEMGTEMRYDTYDLNIEKPEPLVGRDLRLEVEERIGADGAVVRPLDPASLEPAAQALRAAGVRSVAVCLLHAYKNPAHELALRDWLATALPGCSVSISSEVAPEIREYQRASTTLANAYVQPIAERYLGRLVEDLRGRGYQKPLYMMLSSGGIVTQDAAAAFPVRLVESGPAAGAIAAATIGRRIGRPDILSFDMGGTTAKACLIEDGRPTLSRDFEVARVRRFDKGSGLPLQVPVIEMIEIGAGGGSIARADALGLLKVGPDSAGSSPGPACYGLGGTAPTVTDANLLLGCLDEASFLGGAMVLDRAAAQAAVARLAAALKVDAHQAAVGILQVVNANMIAAAKMHVAERGKDPRGFTMLAFGGMGPMHAHAVARGLRVAEIVCPASAGVLSAWGMLAAPISFEFARSLVGRLSPALLDEARALLAALAAQGMELVQAAGSGDGAIETSFSIEMRHVAQTREIGVALEGDIAALDAEALRARFLARYQARYGHSHPNVPIELVTCRAIVSAPPSPLSNVARAAAGGAALRGTRRLFDFEQDRFVEAGVYDRYALRPGEDLPGPCLIEERESTVVVPADARAFVDDDLNVVIRMPH